MLKMLKKLASLILPNSRKLSRTAAEGITVKYNGLPEKQRKRLAYYSKQCRVIEEFHKKIDEIIADGQIDEAETYRIAWALEPMIESARKIIFA